MSAHKTKQVNPPLVVRGRNGAGEIIEGVIPAGELSGEDPGLVIQKILAKRKGVKPTPVSAE